MFRSLLTAAVLPLITMIGAAAPANAASQNFSRFASQDCAIATDCLFLNMGTVPAGHIYEITFVNCRGRVGFSDTNVEHWFFQAKVDTKFLGRMHIPPIRIGGDGEINGDSHVIGVATGLVRARAGAALEVRIRPVYLRAGSYAQVVDCTISGQDITP